MLSFLPGANPPRLYRFPAFAAPAFLVLLLYIQGPSLTSPSWSVPRLAAVCPYGFPFDASKLFCHALFHTHCARTRAPQCLPLYSRVVACMCRSRRQTACRLALPYSPAAGSSSHAAAISLRRDADFISLPSPAAPALLFTRASPPPLPSPLFSPPTFLVTSHFHHGAPRPPIRGNRLASKLLKG